MERSVIIPEPQLVRPLAVVGSLGWREIVRFFRQPNRIVGAVGTPVVFWLLFGTGLHQSFRVPVEAGQQSPDYLNYFFPGTLLLILMFTAIFSTISIIEDRREGFLQGVLVAPIPRWTMVAGKVLGGTLIAVSQGLLFLLLGLFLDLELGLMEWLPLLGLLLITAFGLTSLGFVLAWRLDSTQGFHALMNLLLMPMWLLSGALFPIPALGESGAAGGQVVMHWLMRLNPLAYALSAARQLMFTAGDTAASPLVCWLVTIGFGGLMFAAAWQAAGRRISGDLL